MYSDWLPDYPDPDLIARQMRERESRWLDQLAANIINCCEWCGCALHKTGIMVAGGIAVIMSTCPQCDTYREGDDA